MPRRLHGALVAIVALASLQMGPAVDTAGALPTDADPVVVATFDTGTNPFHPCFRRATPSLTGLRREIPNYPSRAESLPLTFGSTYKESLAASKPAIERIRERKLYFVPNTNLSFYGVGADAHKQFVDTYPHGAQASSQIACERYGMAPNAHLVVLNWYHQGSVPRQLVQWVAEQDWIDVVHLNVQDLPFPVLWGSEGIERLIAKGKMVVIAAGNGTAGFLVNYPMELSRYNGPPGSLIAGANDNEGWTVFTNLDPHVVMDGDGTVAAAHDSYEDSNFSGTSSASPRVTGYVARIIGELRREFGHTWRGLVTIPADRRKPKTGPLADGELTAAELHEVVRKTANPNPHPSRFDGSPGVTRIPQPVDLPFAFYPKMGYGEVSEHTIDAAIDVLAGRAPMPARPHEDAAYEVSEDLRHRLYPPSPSPTPSNF